MKNVILTFLALFALIAFKSPEGEAVYNGTQVSYNVEKTNGVVLIKLGIKDPTSIESLVIMRSDNPSKYFREVKQLSKNELDNMGSENVLVDKYPLPSTMSSYYKIKTIDVTGVQRSYPSVKLNTK